MDTPKGNNEGNSGHDKPVVAKTSWAKAFWKVGLPAVILIPILIFAYQTFLLPITSAKEIASAFKTGTITTEFISYVTEVEGMNYLQAASLKTQEILRKRVEKTYLMISTSAEVEIDIPVKYTFYIDLKDKWEFRWDDRDKRVIVLAPRIKYNDPAPDISKMNVRNIETGLLIDEDSLRDDLQKELTLMLAYRAKAKIKLIKEVARSETKKFIETWFINNRFKDYEEKPIIKALYFEDDGEVQEIIKDLDSIERR